MKKALWSLVICFGVIIGIGVATVQADPPKIQISTQPTESSQADVAAAPSEPISETVAIPDTKEWKEYDNRIVKAHVRIKSKWVMMEIKETKDNGAVSFTLSRSPGPLVTVEITRQPMDAPFEEWISSASLTPLYASGYKESRTQFAGRKATLIKGIAKDGRMDESYFVPQGGSISQISFTAPPEAWKDYEQAFAALKASFRWLP